MPPASPGNRQRQVHASSYVSLTSPTTTTAAAATTTTTTTTTTADDNNINEY